MFYESYEGCRKQQYNNNREGAGNRPLCFAKKETHMRAHARNLVLTTFSIAARCPRTGMVGVAVCTAVPAVGALCPFAKPGVGAIASQSFVNPYLGIDGLALLEKGIGAQAA